MLGGLVALVVAVIVALGITAVPQLTPQLASRILIGSGVASALGIVIFLLQYGADLNSINRLGSDFSYGLSFGFWVAILATIAMIVGGVMAMRKTAQPRIAASRTTSARVGSCRRGPFCCARSAASASRESRTVATRALRAVWGGSSRTRRASRRRTLRRPRRHIGRDSRRVHLALAGAFVRNPPPPHRHPVPKTSAYHPPSCRHRAAFIEGARRVNASGRATERDLAQPRVPRAVGPQLALHHRKRRHR